MNKYSLLGICWVLTVVPVMAQQILTPLRLIDDAHIGYITSVDVDSMAHIYITDQAFNTVRVYTPEGRPVRTIGREGQGPDEFQSLMQAGIYRSILYAYDFLPRKLAIFTLEGALQDTRILRESPEGAFPMPTGDVLSGARIFWITSNGHLLFLYGFAVSNPTQVTSGTLKIQLRHVTEDGTPGPPLVTLPDRERYVRSTARGWATGTLPFGARPVLALTPNDEIVYGYTRTLELYIKPMQGEVRKFFVTEVPRIPITDDMLRNYLRELGREEAFSFFRDIVPHYLPVFHDMVADDEGRVWVAVNTPDAFSAGQTEYWVLSHEGEVLRKVRLDRVAYFYLIREGVGYAITASPEGAHQLALYRLAE